MKQVVSWIPIWVCLYFLFVFSCFYRQFVTECFVLDLLRWVILLLTVSFFVSFRVSNSDDKVRYYRVIISNFVYQYAANLES